MLACMGSVRRLTQAAVSSALTAAPLSTQAGAVQYPYFVSRNTNGNLPVYTDIRNAESRFLVQIRNVDGDATVLANELSETLFQRGSSEARRMKISTNHQHVVISGGRWKQPVVEWLKSKGF